MTREEAQAVERWYIRILILAMIACIVLALTGCGGGGDDDEPTGPNASTQPVDCKTHPELCK